jgi:hypothetical protein
MATSKLAVALAACAIVLMLGCDDEVSGDPGPPGAGGAGGAPPPPPCFDQRYGGIGGEPMLHVCNEPDLCATSLYVEDRSAIRIVPRDTALCILNYLERGDIAGTMRVEIFRTRDHTLREMVLLGDGYGVQQEFSLPKDEAQAITIRTSKRLRLKAAAEFEVCKVARTDAGLWRCLDRWWDGCDDGPGCEPVTP